MDTSAKNASSDVQRISFLTFMRYFLGSVTDPYLLRHLQYFLGRVLSAGGTSISARDLSGCTPGYTLLHALFSFQVSVGSAPPRWRTPGRKRISLRTLAVLILEQPGGIALINQSCYSPEQCTVLHFAAKRNVRADVELLLENGADPTVRNADLDTPADIAWRACEFYFQDVIHKYESNVAPLLSAAARYYRLGEWRPRAHAQFPGKLRERLCALTTLWRARLPNLPFAGENEHYTQAGLLCLPEELFQYLLVYVCGAYTLVELCALDDK